MKLGLALAPSPATDPLASMAGQAREAESAGIDIGWLDSAEGSVTALISAAATADATTSLRLVACVPVGGHPLEIAEAAAVADNCSNGRIVVVLEDESGEPGLLDETTDVVIAAAAPRPFRHAGPRWAIPANLPENDQHEERIILTPTFVQTDLPVWLSGPGAPTVARERGLPHVAAAGDDPDLIAAAWSATEEALGAVAARLRRVGSFRLDASAVGDFDDDRLVASLLAARRAWGLDTAILRPGAELDDAARGRIVARLATRVRPRVLMHELPAGLEAHWKAVLGR